MALINQMVYSMKLLLGSGGIIMLLICAFLIIVLLIARAGKYVVFVVILPLILTVSVYSSQFLEIPRWAGTAVWIIAGILMAFVFWMFIR